MLCQFTFENYKSFRDETTLDCQAGAMGEFKDSLLKTEGVSGEILPLAVIYGPNGGGKSGVLEALQCLIGQVLRPIATLEDAPPASRLRIPHAWLRPFKFDTKSRNAPTSFEIFFRTSSAEYRYFVSFEYRTDKAQGSRLSIVSEEFLYRKSFVTSRQALVFERTANGVRFGGTIKPKPPLNQAKSTLPFLPYLYISYDIPEINDVIGWFRSCIVFSADNRFRSESTASKLAAEEKHEEDLRRLLKHMDVGIDDYRILSKTKLAHDGAESVLHEIRLIHAVGDDLFQLAENEESGGTQRVLRLLPDLLKSLKDGFLLIADELDSQLHPKLLEQILLLYANPDLNTGHGQLLLTSHDIGTLKSSVFRRDEIWFAAKDESESSVLYSLSEIRDEKGAAIRADASFSKQYLDGRYGADPSFEQMRRWG